MAIFTVFTEAVRGQEASDLHKTINEEPSCPRLNDSRLEQSDKSTFFVGERGPMESKSSSLGYNERLTIVQEDIQGFQSQRRAID